MTLTVGIFGLGLIGCAAAERLLDAGHRVIGHDPDERCQTGLAHLGGRASAPAEVWTAPTVLIAVFDAAQVRAVLATAPPMTQADVLVMTTCDPEGIESLGSVARAGISLVEAPVSGSSAQLRRGEAAMFLAGPPAAVARVQPVAKALAPRIVELASFGEAARVKLAINLILGLNRAALAEGLVLAKAMGLDPAVFLSIAQSSAAASAVMSVKGPRMVTGDFAPEGRVSQSAKDFSLILGVAEGKGLALPFASAYLGVMESLIAAGDGALDNSAVILALERGHTRRAVAQETRT